jgi:hypothetical protein
LVRRYKRLATDLFASASDVPYRILAGLRDMLLGVVLALGKDAIPHQDLGTFSDLLVCSCAGNFQADFLSVYADFNF